MRWADVGLVAGIYVVFAATGHLVGFRMYVPWGNFQLLDAPILRADPLGSLCYLHSQPPALNALLAVVLRVAAALAVPPEHVAAVWFLPLGLAGALALAYVTIAVTGSRLLAALAVLAMLGDPGFHVHGHVFFYEFVDQALGFLLLAATVCYLRDGRRVGLVAGVVAVLALTRTIFHPLWAFGYCALAILLRSRLAPEERARLAHGTLAAAILVPALVAWPLKNLLVYGRFTTASMTEYSLSR